MTNANDFQKHISEIRRVIFMFFVLYQEITSIFCLLFLFYILHSVCFHLSVDKTKAHTQAHTHTHEHLNEENMFIGVKRNHDKDNEVLKSELSKPRRFFSSISAT